MQASYEKFDELLQQKGLSISNLCSATNIPQSTFSDWKKGKSVPKLPKLYKISKFLNVSIESLLDEMDK